MAFAAEDVTSGVGAGCRPLDHGGKPAATVTLVRDFLPKA